jgi:hypothetical protein
MIFTVAAIAVARLLTAAVLLSQGDPIADTLSGGLAAMALEVGAIAVYTLYIARAGPYELLTDTERMWGSTRGDGTAMLWMASATVINFLCSEHGWTGLLSSALTLVCVGLSVLCFYVVVAVFSKHRATPPSVCTCRTTGPATCPATALFDGLPGDGLHNCGCHRFPRALCLAARHPYCSCDRRDTVLDTKLHTAWTPDMRETMACRYVAPTTFVPGGDRTFHRCKCLNIQASRAAVAADPSVKDRETALYFDGDHCLAPKEWCYSGKTR